jgi:hypothetical protein
VEVTSLVRHSHYQDELKTTNPNANTSVPMHTMGLAFDIGLVNSSLKTVYEIRDVLQRMQQNGDILFIGERKQLVFHVVPNPSRLGHFTDVYIQKVGLPATSRSAHVVASLPGRPVRHRTTPVQPRVETEVLTVLPAHGSLEDWMAADKAEGAALMAPEAPAGESRTISALSTAGRWFVLLAGLCVSSWRIAAGRRT